MRIPPVVHPPHPLYRATTAVFVRQNGQLGVVPMHPLDKEGKTPLNLEHGVFSTEPARNAMQPALSAAGGQKWETVKSPPQEAMSSGLVATTAPVRTSRTLIEGSGGTRIVSLGQNSSIVYDPREHRFVNANSSAAFARPAEAIEGKNAPDGSKNDHLAGNNPPAGTGTRGAASASVSARAAAPPSRAMAPPPARSSGSGGGS